MGICGISINLAAGPLTDSWWFYLRQDSLKHMLSTATVKSGGSWVGWQLQVFHTCLTVLEQVLGWMRNFRGFQQRVRPCLPWVITVTTPISGWLLQSLIVSMLYRVAHFVHTTTIIINWSEQRIVQWNSCFIRLLFGFVVFHHQRARTVPLNSFHLLIHHSARSSLTIENRQLYLVPFFTISSNVWLLLESFKPLFLFKSCRCFIILFSRWHIFLNDWGNQGPMVQAMSKITLQYRISAFLLMKHAGPHYISCGVRCLNSMHPAIVVQLTPSRVG